jgi:hypothetical protein
LSIAKFRILRLTLSVTKVKRIHGKLLPQDLNGRFPEH